MKNRNKEIETSDIYCTKAYLSSGRLIAFVEQYKFIDVGDRVLEIGTGSGLFKQFVSTIAKYHSVDIDSSLDPDYILDIADTEMIGLIPKKYNKIFCCQVLEHMPFENAIIAVSNIFKLGADIVCFSLPDNRKFFRVCVKAPKVFLKKVFTIPFTGHKIDYSQHGQHYWELYSNNIKQIEIEIAQAGFLSNYFLFKQYRLFERPYQHFYIFKKIY